MVRETVIEVLDILENNQESYIDPAEYIHDAMKNIRRHLDDKDLILYVDDFIFNLSASVNNDFDGVIQKCINKLIKLGE